MPRLLMKVMLRLGKLAEITVVGRKSGVERTAVVSSVPAPDGGHYVGAGDETHQWARNLQAAGRCRLRVKGESAEFVATELSGAERATAVKALLPPYGSFHYDGPVFRLDRVEQPSRGQG